QILVGLGFNEIVSNSLFSEDEASFNNLKPIKILNPISNDLCCLRTSLIPGILKSVSLNHRFSEFNLQLFEVGKVFINKGEVISDFKDFDEKTNLALCLTGSNCELNWQRKEKGFDIFEFKGIITEFLNKISLDKVTFNSYHTLENSYYDIEIKVFTDNTYIGSLYRLKMDYLSKFEIERELFVGEFDYSLISQLPKVSKKFKQISNYPVVERDISFFISKEYSFAQIEEQILSVNDKLLRGIHLFDQYVSKDDPTRKSLAIRLEFQSNEKTLTSEEVEKRVKKIVSNLEKQFNIQLRTSSQ
ncbi:MAG: hypothetical protein N3A61_09910, partial [Ignavibacteria bacterium]|nr:hypothetical protein [Ignavibacteria bacterium]